MAMATLPTYRFPNKCRSEVQRNNNETKRNRTLVITNVCFVKGGYQAIFGGHLYDPTTLRGLTMI